jgi:hypothetical protein
MSQPWPFEMQLYEQSERDEEDEQYNYRGKPQDEPEPSFPHRTYHPIR